MKRMILVAIATTVSTLTAIAEEPFEEFQLKGVGLLGSDNLIDPKPGAGDTHMHFFIEGDAAAAMYNAMPAKAEEDLCTGGMMKRAPSGFMCLEIEGSYECYVTIEMKSGASAEPGVVC